MKEHMKKIKTKRFGIILFVLVAVAVTIFFSSYAIFGELEGQLEQNLEDVAAQNALALHNKIHSNYELIVSLSDNMHGVEQGEDIEERLQSLEIFLDEYNLKRFAYAFPDGTSYATPFVTGAAALLMEQAILGGTDPYLYGEKMKAWMCRHARRLSGTEELPNDKTGWGGLCVSDSLPELH